MAFTTKIDKKNKHNKSWNCCCIPFRLLVEIYLISFFVNDFIRIRRTLAHMRLQQIGYKPSWKNTWTIPNTRWPFWRRCKALLPSDIFFFEYSQNYSAVFKPIPSVYSVQKNWISHVEKASRFRVIISPMKNFIYFSIFSLWTSKSDFDFLKPF